MLLLAAILFLPPCKAHPQAMPLLPESSVIQNPLNDPIEFLEVRSISCAVTNRDALFSVFPFLY